MLRLSRLALLAIISVVVSGQGYQGPATPAPAGPAPAGPAPAGPAPAGPAPAGPAPAGPAPAGPAPAGPAPAGPAPAGPAPAGPGASAPGSGLPPRIATAAYSCTKIPFKKECTTGFPSQLVLRWYLKDGKCCSYPYGHCKGEDDTLTNPGIRTKADCESICVKGDKSQPGAGPAAGGGGGGAAAPGAVGPAAAGGGGGPGGAAPTGGAAAPGGAGGASAPGSGLPPRVATAQYSCTKIPFKGTCTTGFPSQLVLRWYLKDGKCCSYPYGHCKGEDDTLTNPGIRTKADCESICVKGDKSQPGAGPAAGGGGGAAAPGGGGPAPSGGGGGGGAPTGGAPPPGGAAGPGASAPGSGLPPRVATAAYSCTKIPFKKDCTTGFPSQLVLRWYLKDGKCCSYPYGHCKGEDDTLTNPGIRTKADCESICIKGDKSQPGGSPGGSPGTGVAPTGGNLPGGIPNQPGAGSPGTGVPAAGGPSPGGQPTGSGLPPRVATAQYSCTKIPFKGTCTTGFPSQLVLRWYLKDGKCCSYPYGHCKGEDDTLTNPGIRTKADCESICVKGDKSQPGTNVPGTNVPGTNVPGTNVPGTNVPGTNQPGYPGGR